MTAGCHGADWIAAILDLFDRLESGASGRDDCQVRGTQVLLGPIVDRTIVS